MNNIQAINLRESRRLYLEKEIDIKKMIKLKKIISDINEEQNLGIALIDDAREAFLGFKKSYGFFKGVGSVIALKGPKDDEYLKEKIGYYGEKIVLEATKMGLGTCWVGGTFDPDDIIFNTQPEEELICVLTIGYSYREKSLRERVIHSVTHRKIKHLEEFYIADTNKIPDWFLKGVELMAKAPSTKNGQPVKLQYINGNINIFVNDKNEFDLVDLGIAKLHFEIGACRKFERGNNSLLILE